MEEKLGSSTEPSLEDSEEEDLCYTSGGIE